MKKTASELAQWAIMLPKFDFEIAHQRETYPRATREMSVLPQKATDKLIEIADFENDIAVYCIVGHISKPNKLPEKIG